MGLFGNRIRSNTALKGGKAPQSITKMIECPKCHTRATVTFLNKNDSYTCKKCGRKIWCEKL